MINNHKNIQINYNNKYKNYKMIINKQSRIHINNNKNYSK